MQMMMVMMRYDNARMFAQSSVKVQMESLSGRMELAGAAFQNQIKLINMVKLVLEPAR